MRTLDVLSVVLRCAAGCWLLFRIPRPASPPDGWTRPSCSVVVPARDEVRTLPLLLSSLEPQLGPRDEVLVVDDHSSDGTGELATGARTTVLAAPDLPASWTGKSWACWTGARRARGEVLVFLDADVRLDDGGLDRLVAAQTARGGLVSVQPFHVVERPYERLSAFFNVVAMMGVDAFTPRGERRSPRGAFGPALVVARSDYEALGGHEAVRAEVLDDVALAARWTAAGRPPTVLGGQGTARFRMYPGGVRQLVEGWSKNVASGAVRVRLTTLVLVVAWISLCLTAAWGVLRLPFADADAATTVAAAGTYALVAAQLWWMLRRIGTFGWATALLYPAPLAAFLVLFCRSALLTAVRGSVPWKGRAVPTRPTAQDPPSVAKKRSR